MYVQPTNYKPKPQTPYGQIIIVNKIYYSYLHVKSGAVCPQAFLPHIVKLQHLSPRYNWGGNFLKLLKVCWIRFAHGNLSSCSAGGYMLQVICLTPDLWQSSRLLPQTAQVTLPLAYVMAGRGARFQIQSLKHLKSLILLSSISRERKEMNVFFWFGLRVETTRFPIFEVSKCRTITWSYFQIQTQKS